MLTKVLNEYKYKIKPKQKWENKVINMEERHDARKKIKKVSQR